MATYFARKAGNINATDVWATTPSGTAAAVTFASGDVLVANSFAITVNVSTDLGSNGQVRNDTTGGATGGGSFTLNNNVTLTASVYNSTGSTCIAFSANAPAVAYIVANEIKCFGTSNAPSVNNSGTGTLNITATNIFGGAAGSGGIPSAGVLNSGAGNTNITCSGVIIGGSAGQAPGVANTSNLGTLTITGNVQGGTSSEGARNSVLGTIVIIGSAIGSSTSSASGVTNVSTGTVKVTRAVGNAYGPGNTSGLAAAVGASNSGLGVIEVQELEFGAYGQSAVSGTGIRLKKANTNIAIFNYVDAGSAKNLVDATQGEMPAASNVRSGVTYASGALTGTCAVPAAGSVALGVPVDNTTGTAILTQAAVQAALTAQGLTTARAGNLDNLDTTVSSRLAPSGTLATVTNLTNAPASVTPADIWSHPARTITGGVVDTLTNAPLVPSAAAIATQVRSELSVELARIDAATSTRATPANIPTADITAIKGKTDLLNTTRLGQVATTEIVGNLLAQANS